MSYHQDLAAFAVTLCGALSVIRATPFLERRRITSKAETRKVTHIACGLIYMLSWILYSDSTNARFIASIAVMLPTLQALVVGLGLLKDEKLLSAMTRSNEPSELLYGPLMYGLMSVIWTNVFWRSSAVGVVGLVALYAGDGMAGLLGLRFGSLLGPLPHNRDKTWVGSIACFASTLLVSIAMISYFNAFGQLQFILPTSAALNNGYGYWGGIFGVCMASSLTAAAMESLRVQEIDNLIVPIAASLTALLTMSITGLQQ